MTVFIIFNPDKMMINRGYGSYVVALKHITEGDVIIARDVEEETVLDGVKHNA